MTTNELLSQIAFEVGDNTMTKYPPQLYLQRINHAIRVVYQWLLAKGIDYKITKGSIVTVAAKETYPKLGQTKILILDNQKLPLKNFLKRTNYLISSKPYAYYETLTEIGFLPIPNAIYTIEYHYVPAPANTYLLADIFPYPYDFERVVILEAILEFVKNRTEIPAWKVETWLAEKMSLYENIFKMYQPLRKIEYLFEGVVRK